jgi:hypothetical protein
MAKDSRFAQIYREELKKNKGIFGSLASTGGARAKEMLDLRQYLLPQMGVSGAIAQRVFGKSFKYGGGAGVRNVGGAGTSSISDKVVSEKLTRIDANGKIAAKNSIVLPAMARDMNLMRMNMQKMVKLSGGTPANKADMFFKRAGDRESAYESQLKRYSVTKIDETGKPKSENSGGFLGNLLNFLLSPAALKLLVGAGIGGSIWNFLSDDTKTSIGNFFKDLIVGFLDGLKTAFSTLADFLQDPKVINSIQGLIKSVIDAIGSLLSAVFSTNFETPLGEMNLGIASLAASVALLAPVAAGLVPVLATITAALTGWKIGSALNTAINTIKDANWKDLPNYREQDGIGPATVNPNLAKQGVKLGEAEILKKQGEIKKAEQDMADLDAGKNTMGYDVPRRKAYLQKRIDILKGELNGTQQKTEGVKALVPQSPTPVSGKSETSPTKINNDGLLGIIRQHEGGAMGYEAINKGRAGDTPGGYPGLTNLTIDEVMKKQDNKEIMAAGAYQIIPDTLKGLMQGNYGETGVSRTDKFSPEVQDKLAMALINKRLAGKNTAEEQLASLANEWAFIANPTTGKSAYAGIAGNASSASGTNQVMAALGGKSVPIPNTPRGIPSSTPTEESSFSDTIVTAIAGLLQVSQDTNKQIQAVAAASAKGSESSSAMIESPYDREAFDSLFRYHADIHSSSA